MIRSFTQCQTFIGCPKKYYWNYIRRLVPVSEPGYYTWGKLFHQGVAGLPGPDSLPFNVGVLAARHFHTMPNERREVAEIIDLPNKEQVKVVADCLSDEHVIEYKTTSRGTVETVKAQVNSLQVRLYAVVFSKPKALLRLVKKSALRQRKDENEDMFERRCLQEYIDNPGEKFLQIEVPGFTKVGAIREIVHIINMIKQCEKEDCWPMYAPYGCYNLTTCPYIDLCNGTEGADLMFKEKADENDRTSSSD